MNAVVLDDTGFTLSREENSYADYSIETPVITGEPQPAYRYLRSKSTTRYESSSGSANPSGLTTTYTYDFQNSASELYGNITALQEEPLGGGPAQRLQLEVRYNTTLAGSIYRVNLPISMEVKNGRGTLLRKRRGIYDTRGRLMSLLTYSDGATSHISRITWNSMGLLESITDPRGTRVQYTYDTTAHQYVTAVTTSGLRYPGYTSSMTWNYSMGLTTSRTDPNGLIERSTYDAHGRPTALYTPYDTFPGGTPAVRYSPTHRTSITYDLRGLQTQLESPSTGITTLFYDSAGSLIRKVDANLRRDGKDISYIYDPLGRISRIDYPDMPDVTYTYGAQGAPNNSAGRLISRSDESGSIAYRYGMMGEITREERTLKRLSPLEADRSAVMHYRSDYLGRMESLTYPDGEVISYQYDPGGQVSGIRATRSDGAQSILVKKIGYDKYGQRTFLEYGNGNITTYAYNQERRWLETLKTQNPGSGTTLQNLTYSFDTVGNVLSRSEVTSRYSTSQNYTYDALYQLTAARGNYTERSVGIENWREQYTQSFSYDGLGNITAKRSTQNRFPESDEGSLNYNLDYEYDENKPYQPKKIGEMYYAYDPNGNTIEESVIPAGQSRPGEDPNLTRIGKVRIADQGFGLVNNLRYTSGAYRRMFIWDEENRLKKVQDSSVTVQFLYDADGIRTVKKSGEGETLYYNNWWSETEDLPSFRRSKHIYLGSERLVTRLSIEGVQSSCEELNTYYYHPDHLGSVLSVSDAQGDPYERIEYTPFGEMWIEIREDGDTKDLNYIPFRFTSKEWDSETGLYSFPARYYEPKFSRWMSADPAGFELMSPMEEDREGKLKPRQGYSMIESVNWYSYTSNNPLKYVDPTGMYETISEVYNAMSEKLEEAVNKYIEAGGFFRVGVTVDFGNIDLGGGKSINFKGLVAGQYETDDGSTSYKLIGSADFKNSDQGVSVGLRQSFDIKPENSDKLISTGSLSLSIDLTISSEDINVKGKSRFNIGVNANIRKEITNWNGEGMKNIHEGWSMGGTVEVGRFRFTARKRLSTSQFFDKAIASFGGMEL